MNNSTFEASILKRRLRWILVTCAFLAAFAIVYAVQPSADALVVSSSNSSTSVGGGAAPPPPLARNDRFTVNEDRVLRAGGRGVLRNDRGTKLTALRASNPKNGKLTLRRNGTFTYRPKANFNGRDTFSYRAKDDRGRVNRGVVTVLVRPVNDAPGFTAGPDQSVDEDAGNQTFPGWATNIRKGPANESKQKLTFKVTDNSNASLFSDAPSVSPDGALSFEAKPNANGEATIKLLLRDNGGTARGGKNTSAEQTFTITVEDVNDAPEVTASNDGPIKEDGSATITASASDEENDPLTYSFDCEDDGTFEVGPQAGNTADCKFDDSGERDVNVEVSDSENVGTASTTVIVDNVPPTGTLRNSGDIEEGDSVEMSFEDENGRSTVKDESSVDTNAGFRYEFACGGTFDADPDYESASEDPTASCVFTQDGAKTIAARVIDKDGGATPYTTEVSVANVRQTVTLDGPGTVAESVSAERTYTFTITDPGDDDFEVVTPDFPSCGANGELVDANGADEDGGTFTYDPETETGSFACVFADGPATSDVAIRVRDQDGVTDSDDQPVKVTASVENEAPSATFNAPTSVGEGDDVELSLTDATDPAGDNDAIEYRFKCGEAAWSAYGNTTTASCPTTNDGSIVVKGQVRDEDGGASEEYEKTVAVENVVPFVNATDEPQTADEGVEKSFTLGWFTDPGADGPWNVTVEWGDGSTNDTFTAESPGSLGALDHTYPDGDETYTATVTVAESGGADAPSGVDEFVVDVDNVAPTADGQSVSSNEGERKTVTLTGDDVAADKPLSFKITSLPENGTLFDGETEISTEDLPFTLAGNEVAYEPPDAAFTGDVSFGFRANDGEADSDEATVSIKVEQINEAPTATDDGYEIAEDGTLTFAASELTENDSPGENEDSQNLTVVSVDNAENGAVSLDGKGTPEASDDEITFTPTADYFGAASFEYTVEDDGETAGNPDPLTDVGTVSVTVTEVNDAPAANNDPAQNATYEISEDSETALSVTAENGVLANDAKGPANESGQTLAVSDSDPDTEGVQPESGPDHGSLTLAADGSFEYAPTENNFNGTDEFTYEACDDGTTDGTPDPKCDTATAEITVTAVNDAPILTLAESITVREDEPTPLSGVSAEDADAGSNNVTLSLSVGSGTLSATNGGNVTVSGPGTASLTLTGPVANINTFIEDDSVEFTTAQDATGDVTLDVEINDGGNTGGGAESDSGTLTINVTPVNDAPTATLDEYSGAVGNTKFAVGASNPSGPVVSKTGTVLSNDSDGVEGDSLSATEEEITTEEGGTVNMNPDGSFTYVSAPGFTGDDSFTYEVCDDGETEGTPDPKCAEGTADVGVENVVWYVKNDSTAGGLGRSTDPFDTLAEAENASDANETIFVYEGNGSALGQSSGVSLKNGQRLLGEHVGLSVGGTSLLAANSGARPSITNTNGNGVTVLANTANGNRTGVEIRGFRVSGSTNAVDATSANAANLGVAVSDNIVTGAGSEGVDVNAGSSGTQTLEIHDNEITATGTAIDVNRTAGTAAITRLDDNVVSGETGGAGIVMNAVTLDATPGGAIQTVSGGTTRIGESSDGVGGAGMLLTGNTVGDLSFEDLDVYANNGAGLRVAGAGQFDITTGTRVSVATSGAANLSAVNGPALEASSATVNLPLGTLASANSTTNGLSLSAVGGSFSAGSSSEITNAANADVSIENSTATFNYAGRITDDIGRLVSVTNNATGIHGAKTFSGEITDGGDNDGQGILLDNNDNATVNFTGGLTLSTGSNAAFTATNGGVVNVSDPSGAVDNVITTGTGTALNVSNTNIGSTGMTFRSISANGAPNGVVLNGTGSNGGLTVSGNGGACSSAGTCTGGAIQNTTADGISLTNTRNVSLSSMLIKDAGRNGMFGTGVTNMTLDNVRNEGAGNETGEHAMNFGTLNANNLLGTVNIKNSVITGMYHHGVLLENTSGTLTMAVMDTTFSNTDPNNGATGGDGIFANADGSSTISLDVGGTTSNGCQFSNLETDAVEVNPEGTSGSVGNLDVNGCSIDAVGGGDGALNLGAINSTRGTFDIRNNTITNTEVIGISVAALDDSELTGTIANNTVNGSGGEGMLLIADGGPSLLSPVIKALVADNNVSGQRDVTGVRIGARDGNGGIVHTRFEDNTIATPINDRFGGSDGVRMRAEDGMSLCLDIRNSDGGGNNTSSGTGEPNSGLAGYLVSDRSTGTFQLEGFTSGGSAQTFFNSQNNSGSVRVDADAPVSGTCDTP